MIDEAEEDAFETGTTIDVAAMPKWNADQVRSFLLDVEDARFLIAVWTLRSSVSFVRTHLLVIVQT